MGIAVHRSFLTYVATVVEVEVDDKGEVKIPAVHTAVDAGLVVNPEATRSQFEGAAVFGTSIVRSGEITAKDGVIEQSNFDRLPRGPNERGSLQDECLHRGQRRASGWSRRARSAAVRPCRLQCHFCGERQKDSRTAAFQGHGRRVSAVGSAPAGVGKPTPDLLLPPETALVKE